MNNASENQFNEVCKHKVFLSLLFFNDVENQILCLSDFFMVICLLNGALHKCISR